MDVALMIADGSAKGKADPAFPAHAMPIKSWAEAVWVQRLPRSSMRRLVRFAKKMLKAVVRVLRAGGGLCCDLWKAPVAGD